MATEFIGFEQTSDAVLVKVTNAAGETETIRASYLASAEGARSVARKELNLEFEGFTYPERTINIEVAYDFRRHGYAERNYISDPVEYSNLFHWKGPPDRWRIHFPTNIDDDENELKRPEALQRRLKQFLGIDHDFEICGCNLYTVHQRVANRFRVGRVCWPATPPTSTARSAAWVSTAACTTRSISPTSWPASCMATPMMQNSIDMSGSGGMWRSSTPRRRPSATSGFWRSAIRRSGGAIHDELRRQAEDPTLRASSCCGRRCSTVCARPSGSCRRMGDGTMLRILFSLVSVFVAATASMSPAFAEWPERPIKLIVPFAAGSSSDTIARIIGAKMGEKLGQQVVVENRVGGSTVIGTDAVAKAAPDGYTLGLANTTTHAAKRRAQPQPAVRSDQGFRAGGDDRLLAVRPDQRAAGSGYDTGGVRRAGESQTRRAELCLGRHRHPRAPRGRAVQAPGRRRRDARAPIAARRNPWST